MWKRQVGPKGKERGKRQNIIEGPGSLGKKGVKKKFFYEVL